MNIVELSRALSEKHDLKISEAETYVRSTFELLESTLQKNEEINLTKFGVFQVITKPARKVRNPKTGETVDAPAKNVVKFKPFSQLKESVNN